MSFVVVNQRTLSVNPAEMREAIEREFPPAFEACAGFERFSVRQTSDTEVVVLIFWDTAEHAAAGAAAIGPTVFNAVIAPVLLGRNRKVGPVLVDHAAG